LLQQVETVREKKMANKEMEYRFLGRSGLRVSALSYGAWVTFGQQISDDVAVELLRKAYDLGCNFFDNAEVYAGGKAEEAMGRVLQITKWKRSDYVLSTKIFWGGPNPNDQGLSRKHIIEGLNASLKRLQVEYVDIVFAHRPDKYTPMEETVRAFNRVIEDGKAFYWGTSEWSASDIREAHRIADRLDLIHPIVEQPQYNMFHRKRFESEYAQLYQEYGMGTTIWSPLASGLLTGKYKNLTDLPSDSRLASKNTNEGTWLLSQVEKDEGINGLEEKDTGKIFNKLNILRPLAHDLGMTLPQLGIAWCLKNRDVSTVITGASKVSQLEENFQALKLAPKLTPEILAKIDDILGNKPTPPPTFRRNAGYGF